MNTITRIAAMLTLAATIGLPLAAQAQYDVPPPQPAASGMGEHHHGRRMRDPFIRALHKLTLTDQQKQQIKSDITATMQASKDATPDQRKTNREQLHRQIEALLTPEQRAQLKAESAQERANWKAHHGDQGPPPGNQGPPPAP